MASAMDFIENLEELDIEQAAFDTLVPHKVDIVIKNRKQLMEGRFSTGDTIRPTYYEDPFFKSRAQAEWYANWKEEITPNPKRPKGVPNLYIDGTFHGTIKIVDDGLDFSVGSDSPIAGDIEDTFTTDIYGLDETSTRELIEEEGIQEEFAQKLKDITGLK